MDYPKFCGDCAHLLAPSPPDTGLQTCKITGKRHSKFGKGCAKWCDISDKIPSYETKKEANDPINHPEHYTDGKIETWDFIIDKQLTYCLGNAVKYISRAGKKDPDKLVEDLQKARRYIDREIKRVEEMKNGR